MAWTTTEKEQINKIEKQLASLDRAIRGNNGEVGMLAMVTNHISAEDKCPIHSVVTTLWGDPHKDGKDAKGLVDIVAENERFRVSITSTTRKLMIAAATSIIGAIVTIIFTLLQNMPH